MRRLTSFITVAVLLLSICSFAVATDESVPFRFDEDKVQTTIDKMVINYLYAPEDAEIVFDYINDGICEAELRSWNDGKRMVGFTGIGSGVCYVRAYLADNPDVSDTVRVISLPEFTSSEKTQLSSVQYISNRKFFWYEEEGYYALQFSLLDKDENVVAVPATVDIKITNDNGEVVYDEVRMVSSDDYGKWTNTFSGDYYAATVKIYPEDILPGTSTKGSVKYTVYEWYYFSFPESNSTVSSLPEINLLDACDLTIPELPVTIDYLNYDNTPRSTTRVDKITYEFTKNYDNTVTLTLLFTGEKTFDEHGEGYSSACQIGWKLYDSEGYVLKSGTCYTSSVEQGEKYRDSKETISSLQPDHYTLKIINVS